MFYSFKKWELALMAGLLIGLLTSPVKAENLPLSRWQVPESQETVQYRLCLFPFGVGQAEQPVISLENQEKEPEIVVKFRLLELWEQILAATDP